MAFSTTPLAVIEPSYTPPTAAKTRSPSSRSTTPATGRSLPVSRWSAHSGAINARWGTEDYPAWFMKLNDLPSRSREGRFLLIREFTTLEKIGRRSQGILPLELARLCLKVGAIEL